MPVKILVFSGSARTQSHNKKLAMVAAGMARDADADATFVDLRDYPMPIYDGDLEDAQGLPNNVKLFKHLMISSQGMLIASPEYNSAISPLLKNALDWASRSEEDGEKPLIAFRGKTAALLSTSPGALGGLRGLAMLRSILGNLGMLVIPQQKAIPHGHNAFDSNDELVDEAIRQSVQNVVTSLIDITRRQCDEI